MIDYQAIVDNLTEDRVKKILDQLQIPYQDKGSFLIMPTYCHNHKEENASQKLYYYKNNKIFMCYTECGTQSIFKFLKHYYDAQNIEYDWYKDIYQVIVEEQAPEGFSKPKYESLREKYGTKSKEIELPRYNPGVLGCFIRKYPPEWLSDGISKAAIDKYQIRYSISQNKIIIPHFSAIDGSLCGIRGRALNEYDIETFGKYMPVQIEGVWYKHPLSLNLYGLYQNKEEIKKHKICYVFEAEKSVLQFESFNLPHCAVAVCGSQFNKFQLNLLLKIAAPEEIVICFDKEEQPGEDKYFNKLWSICDRYKQYVNFSFIYDRLGLLELKDSPSDKGEEVFKKLLEKRVRVK